MLDHVNHETYKGYDVRSNPFEVEPGKWRVRIDVTPPKSNDDVTEYLDETCFYANVIEAHKAGHQYGRNIVDERRSSLTQPDSAGCCG
jgi:hypothetical protein